MVERMREITPIQPEKKKDSDAKNESTNRGKLIIDATSAPADISYPTDLGLLNRARVHTEKIIETFCINRSKVKSRKNLEPTVILPEKITY